MMALEAAAAAASARGPPARLRRPSSCAPRAAPRSGTPQPPPPPPWAAGRLRWEPPWPRALSRALSGPPSGPPSGAPPRATHGRGAGTSEAPPRRGANISTKSKHCLTFAGAVVPDVPSKERLPRAFRPACLIVFRHKPQRVTLLSSFSFSFFARVWRRCIPVDLNALLYRMETTLAAAHNILAASAASAASAPATAVAGAAAGDKVGAGARHAASSARFAALAAARKEAMDAVLWDDNSGRWRDAWIASSPASSASSSESVALVARAGGSPRPLAAEVQPTPQPQPPHSSSGKRGQKGQHHEEKLSDHQQQQQQQQPQEAEQQQEERVCASARPFLSDFATPLWCGLLDGDVARQGQVLGALLDSGLLSPYVDSFFVPLQT